MCVDKDTTKAMADAEAKVEHLACFLAELTLLDYSFVKFAPSMVAAASVLLALFTLESTPWSPTLNHYSCYSTSNLRECVEELNSCFLGSKKSTLPAVREKYAQPRYKCVSMLQPHEKLPEWIWQMDF